jgi:c-di-GMP-binding flagellar brake protein YcgR
MYKIPLKIGETLYLMQDTNNINNGNSELTYKARIADYNADYISIELPLSEETGRIGFFSEGKKIEVWLYTPEGAKYTFECLAIGRRKERIPLMLISHPLPNTVRREQRREFLRVPCYEEIAMHPLQSGDFNPFIAKFVDLSGGGLAFISLEKPKISTEKEFKWWLSLVLKSGPILHPSGTAKLIRIIPPAEKGLPYKCPIEFTNLAETERQKIIRFCYERQLEIKKKGVAF